MTFRYTLVAWATVACIASAAPVDFTREVRPILSQHCFKCHGPDDNVRKAGLRFDRRDGALAKGKSGEVSIVPGKPEASEFMRRVLSADESEVMPPPATKKPLSDAQKQILKQWIAEGAVYQDHWSFVAPKLAPRPVVQQADWPKNSIDYYVLARLEAAGLKPSPQADKATLVRRLYLDLIGLPPTVAEADEFINDPSPEAYERLVDRLLKSSHYGERWARRWLDLARYADTNGYEKDRARTMWLYRDWVIKALNDDKPFDMFTIEQLAGDMLPRATLEQRIATGFHRNTMLNEEGGADPLEFRWHAMNDRVATTGTVWLGLTLNCCQCHNHKYDPVSQKDYFGLFGFLNNADEPTIDVPNPEIAQKRTEAEKVIAAKQAELAKHFLIDPLRSVKAADTKGIAEARAKYLAVRFEAWRRQERAKAIQWSVAMPKVVRGNIPSLEIEGGGIVFVGGDKSKRDVYDVTLTTDLKNITAMRIEALPDERLPANGPGRVSYEGPFGDFFLCEVTLTSDGKPVKLAGASADYFEGNNRPPLAVDGDPLTGWSINGGQGREHALVVNFAEPLNSPGKLDLSMLFEKYYAAGLGKFRVSFTSDATKAEARGLPAAIEALVRKPEADLAASDRDALLQHFLSVAPELKPQRDEIAKLRAAMPKYPTALVMVERPRAYPRTTFLHKRGEFTQPAQPVSPAVPGNLPPLPAGATADRLGFAGWLVSPENPLTARVTVNRAWAALFGRGIVRTTEDFGLQGEPPTHPELLDTMAVEFMRDGWSMKRLHKRIAMSATYQQSSRITPAMIERDPKNELLGRAPRFRLEGELVRDMVLKASGLLSPKIGGPSVFPPQPANVTTEGAYGGLTWTVSHGEDRYRRGLYTYAKRTAPFAMFTTFDAPSGEACVARREMSNTPLQALTLLNDAAFIEAAQALGKLLSAAPGSTADKARDLFRRCVTRPPTDDELKLVVDFFERQKNQMAAKGPKRSDLAGDGADATRAAWTATARAVLNLDETVTRE